MTATAEETITLARRGGLQQQNTNADMQRIASIEKTFVGREQPVIVVRSRSPSPFGRSRCHYRQPLSWLSTLQTQINIRERAEVIPTCELDSISNRPILTTIARQSVVESMRNASTSSSSSSIVFSDVRSIGLNEFNRLNDEAEVETSESCEIVTGSSSRDVDKKHTYFANKSSCDYQEQLREVLHSKRSPAGCSPLATTSSFQHRQVLDITSHENSDATGESNSVETNPATEATKNDKRQNGDVCAKTFSNRRDIKLQHIVKTPHRCNICSKTFSNYNNLVMHTRIHTDARPYDCSVCEKKFKRKHHLLAHSLLHTGTKPHRCSVCGKDFRQKQTLEEHARIHTDAKPYRCGVCGKNIRTKRLLEQHVRIHTGTKPFKCSVCGKDFRQKSTLVNHVRIHTGTKPFRCSVCSKSFRTVSTLHRHTARIHTDKDPIHTDVIFAAKVSDEAATCSNVPKPVQTRPIATPIDAMSYRCTFCDDNFAIRMSSSGANSSRETVIN